MKNKILLLPVCATALASCTLYTDPDTGASSMKPLSSGAYGWPLYGIGQDNRTGFTVVTHHPAHKKPEDLLR